MSEPKSETKSEPAAILQPAAVAAQITAGAPRAAEKTAGKPASGAAGPPGGAGETAPEGPRDSLGRLFDAKRFRAVADGSPFLNKRGQFMPRGGRKPRNRETAAGSAPGQPPGEPPAGSVWTAEERAAAQTAEPPAAAEGGNGGTAPETGTQAPPGTVTPSGARRAAARAGTRLLYTGAGILTGNPEEAVPPRREDEELQDTAAYVMEMSGWNPGPVAALGVLVLTYGLYVASRPKNQEALAARWKALWRRGAEKTAAPAAPARTVEPARPGMAPGAGTPLATGE
jgi:hypothetical protein